MKDHKSRVVEEFTICFIVTSDSVYRGEKIDEIKPIFNDIEIYCSKAKKGIYTVVPNDRKIIEETAKEFLRQCDVIIVTGGTGLSKKDISVDVIRSMAIKDVPGIGEIFRYLSYRDIGIYSYISRAGGYVVNNSFIVVVPGNPRAVELMIREILCHIAPHVVYELRYT